MFKRNIVFMFVILAGFLFLMALPTGTVQAGPASPVTFTLTQPDGTTFTAIQWGDETVNGYETLDGYAIAQQAGSDSWYYLTVASNGGLAPAYSDSSLMVVGQADPAGLKKHLRPTDAPLAGSALAPETTGAIDSPPAIGTHKVAVFLVGFPLASGRTDPSYWQNLIFGGVGSLKDYYETASYGAFSIEPAAETSGVANDGIIGWLDLSAYYDAHPNPGSTVSDVNKYITKRALQVGDSYINFASFDTDANGCISSDELHIIVIVAGYERSYTGTDVPAVWAHNSDLSGVVGAPTLDGKIIANASRGGSYTQVGEYHVDHSGTMGVIAHEFGHDLKWPDQYDIDGSSYGVGKWTLMGTGSWNGIGNSGDSPALPDVWSKWYQGWLTPTTISGYSYGQNIPQIETNPTAFLLRPNPDAVDWLYGANSGQGEYFLVENRQQTSYDIALPGEGLLIWHIDENLRYDNWVNANENHPLVKLIQADGLNELASKTNMGNDGDPYPGSTDNRSLTVRTLPNSTLYNATDSYVRVTNISDSLATMTADLLYGYAAPSITNLDPPYSFASTVGFTLALYGQDFYSNSIVRWNGSDRTTYYDSPTKLRVSVTAADMSTLGAAPNHSHITVYNPQPGGGVSAPPKEFHIVSAATILPINFLSLVFKDYSVGPGFIQLMSQTFEGSFPTSGWEVAEAGTDVYMWGRRDCRSYTGTYSGWAVGGGTNGSTLGCGSTYPESVDSYITYGPFSTENGYINGEVKFKFWLNSEPGWDYLWVTAGTGGSNEWGYKISGNSGGWLTGTLNLNDVDGYGTSVIGHPKVWIRFRFTSDYLNSTGEGAFLDDIILRVCKATTCTGTYSPSYLPPGVLETQPSGLFIEPVMISTEP
jgi:M6 family metalloprotease-like protein